MPRTAPQTTAQAPRPSVLLSSAQFLRNANRSVARKTRISREGARWQAEAWRYRDTVGELRYAVSWFSNAMSRAALRPARRQADGSWKTVETGPEVETLEAIFGTNQSQMLKAMGEHYFIAGEWYLIGLNIDQPDEEWFTVAPEELTRNGDIYYLTMGGERLAINPEDSAAVIRIHNPHPRDRSAPDSPVRAVLSNLAEIEGLSRHIQAQVRSRLAGAGILFITNEMTFQGPVGDNEGTEADSTNDPFMQALGNAMIAAIEDPGDPASFVPIVARVPGDQVDKINHMTFWSAIDEKAGEMRDSAIRRFALGVDLPPELLLGTSDVNHWGAWQIEESSIKAHIEPALEVVAASATTLLRDALDDDDVIVLYDTSALRLRPNRSKEAMELYDRGEIKAKALLRETGFADEDEMDDTEREQWLLRKVASGSATPDQVEAALRLLGVQIDTRGEGETREARPDPSLREHPERGLPDEDGTPAAKAATLQTACDALVLRALERAGNRLGNRTRARPPGIEATEMYLHIRPRNGDLEHLLDDAWTPLPRLIEHTGYDTARVRESLDAYARGLLSQGQEHSPERMMRLVTAGLESG